MGTGSIAVNTSDILTMLGKPEDFYFQLHSTSVPATATSPFHSWAVGPFPKLVTVVTLNPTDSAAGQGVQATVVLSFQVSNGAYGV